MPACFSASQLCSTKRPGTASRCLSRAKDYLKSPLPHGKLLMAVEVDSLSTQPIDQRHLRQSVHSELNCSSIFCFLLHGID